MTQFHEGQDVDVYRPTPSGTLAGQWCKAKIVKLWNSAHGHFDRPDDYKVKFADGTHAVFDADHIRARLPLHSAHSAWAAL